MKGKMRTRTRHDKKIKSKITLNRRNPLPQPQPKDKRDLSQQIEKDERLEIELGNTLKIKM
jgi:hypothetical protein